MIGWLVGVVRLKRPPVLVLDVHGVGYEIEAPMSTFTDLPELGAPAELFIHMVVREDAQSLYGFSREHDRDLFRQLLKVNGVGAKLGLVILSGMNADALSRCVSEGDTATLTRLPGIGKKTAERLIIEMRDRLVIPAMGGATDGTPSFVAAQDAVSEAISALISLGFKPPEASKRVAALDTTGLACEDIVRQALQGAV
ncbi:MAG: Holliday junction branch migration protein RuvA [Chromatiales bacterium]|jgi:holliday junction DNA helicase RuvA|nr:Holliday junction branch migration protein RuvA [Chromatiales bacterium]